MSSTARVLFADWKRDPFVGVVGGLSLVGATVMVPYLWVRKVRHVLAEPEEFVWDFSYFYRAADRFAAEPLALYADPDYFYPPPSVLAFLPWLAFPEAIAFVVAVGVNVVLMAVCSVLAVRLWEEYGGAVPSAARWAAVLFALASAPTFQTLKYAQVGPLVLLSGLGALWWLDRRPAGAGLALAAGFWLKLYPLALAPLGLFRAGRVRFAAGLAVGLVAAPLVLLPFVPATLYPDYVKDRVPTIRTTTSTYAINQSLPAALERAFRPAEAALNNRSPALVRAGVRRVTGLVGIALLGGILLAALRGRVGRITAGYLILATLPFLSNFGWEHSYVLALPLLQAAFLVAVAQRQWRWPVGITLACFLVPMLPRAVLEAVVALPVRPFSDLLFVRFPLAVGLAAVVLFAWEKRARLPSPVLTPGA